MWHGLRSVIEEEMSDELALLMDRVTSKAAGTSMSKLGDGEVPSTIAGSTVALGVGHQHMIENLGELAELRSVQPPASLP